MNRLISTFMMMLCAVVAWGDTGDTYNIEANGATLTFEDLGEVNNDNRLKLTNVELSQEINILKLGYEYQIDGTSYYLQQISSFGSNENLYGIEFNSEWEEATGTFDFTKIETNALEGLVNLTYIDLRNADGNVLSKMKDPCINTAQKNRSFQKVIMQTNLMNNSDIKYSTLYNESINGFAASITCSADIKDNFVVYENTMEDKYIINIVEPNETIALNNNMIYQYLGNHDNVKTVEIGAIDAIIDNTAFDGLTNMETLDITKATSLTINSATLVKFAKEVNIKVPADKISDYEGTLKGAFENYKITEVSNFTITNDYSQYMQFVGVDGQEITEAASGDVIKVLSKNTNTYMPVLKCGGKLVDIEFKDGGLMFTMPEGDVIVDAYSELTKVIFKFSDFELTDGTNGPIYRDDSTENPIIYYYNKIENNYNAIHFKLREQADNYITLLNTTTMGTMVITDQKAPDNEGVYGFVPATNTTIEKMDGKWHTIVFDENIGIIEGNTATITYNENGQNVIRKGDILYGKEDQDLKFGYTKSDNALWVVKLNDNELTLTDEGKITFKMPTENASIKADKYYNIDVQTDGMVYFNFENYEDIKYIEDGEYIKEGEALLINWGVESLEDEANIIATYYCNGEIIPSTKEEIEGVIYDKIESLTGKLTADVTIELSLADYNEYMQQKPDAVENITYTLKGNNDYVEEENTLQVVVDEETTVEDIASLVNSGASIAENIIITLEAPLDLTDSEGGEAAKTITKIGTDENPFKGTFDGQNNVIKLANDKSEGATEVEVSTETALFGNIGEGAKVQNIVMENANVNATEDSKVTLGGDVFYPILAEENNGTIENCVVTGAVVYDENVDASKAKGCIVAVNNGTMDHVVGYFTNQEEETVDGNKRNIVIMQNLGVGRNAGQTQKVCNNNKKKNKKISAPEGSDVEDDIREYTDEEMASGEPAYWLNFAGKGYTGAYTRKWSKGKMHPIMATELSKPAVKVVYEIEGASESYAGLKDPVYFANEDDEIEIETAVAPEKVWLGNNIAEEVNSKAKLTKKLVSSAAKDGVITVHLMYSKATGISDAKANMEITVKGHAISIEGGENQGYSIVDVMGRTISEGETGGEKTIVVPAAGIYVVKAGDVTKKIVVR